MITYSTNFMGPISMDWYRERNLVDEQGEIITNYAGGRIDIYGVPGEKYPIEYGLPLMHGEDFNALSDFLDRLTGEQLIPYESLIMLFEAEYGKKIRWYKE